MNFISLRIIEVWKYWVPCKVNKMPFGRHLLWTWPIAFILRWTSEKWKLFLKYKHTETYFQIHIVWNPLLPNALVDKYMFLSNRDYFTIILAPTIFPCMMRTVHYQFMFYRMFLCSWTASMSVWWHRCHCCSLNSRNMRYQFIQFNDNICLCHMRTTKTLISLRSMISDFVIRFLSSIKMM